MDESEKIVDFEKYCPKCENWSKSESEDPCWDCLGETTNVWSHKPRYFKERSGKK